MAQDGRAVLIDSIYDSGFDDEVFAQLPEGLSRSIGGRSCTVQFFSGDWSHFDFVWSYFNEAMYTDYVREFLPDDLWMRVGLSLGLNRAQNMDAHVPYEQHVRSRIYNEFFRAHGDDTAHCLGAVVSTSAGYVSMGVHRAHGQGVFGEAETRDLERVLPHMARLHQLRARLRTAETRADMARGALDRFAFAAMIVGADRRILLANDMAESLLRQRAGVSAFMGRLGCVHPAAERQLARVLMEATSGSPRTAGALLAEQAGGAAPARIMVTPLPYSALNPGGLALVIVESADSPATLADLAGVMYGLSPAEAALAEAVARGDRPEDFALARGVKISTVRTQLSSLLHKTGTARQTQLAALLAGLPGLRRLD